MDRPVRPALPPLAFFVFFAALLAPPAQAATATALTGRIVTLSVAAGGTTPFTYRWYKNGTAITGATSSTFLISSVKTTDAGSYFAVVTNSAGSATSDQAVLTVYAPPVFTTQPVSLTAALGKAATLSAIASGTPTPTYQWKLNGAAIAGATKSSYTIAAVTAASAGTYTVVAANAGGSATSAGAVLTIGGSTTAGAVVAALPMAMAASPLAPAAGGSVSLAAAAPLAGAASIATPSALAGAAGADTLWRLAAADRPDAGNWQVIRIDARPDGETGIFWQNAVTGQAELWIVDGPTLVEVIPLADLPIDPAAGP